GRTRQVGDFAFDPDLGEHVLQQQAGAVVQLADAEHVAVEAETLEGIVDHAGIIAVCPACPKSRGALDCAAVSAILAVMSTIQSILVPQISSLPEAEARARLMLRWLAGQRLVAAQQSTCGCLGNGMAHA